MEPVGLALDASWSSFDDPEVMAQLFGFPNYAKDQDQDFSIAGIQHIFWPDQNSETYYSTLLNSVIGESITTPSLSAAAYHQFNAPVCMNEETSSDEAIESFAKPLLPVANALQATKRRLHVHDAEVPIEEDDSQMAPITKKAKKNVAEESNVDMSCSSYSSEDDSSSKGTLSMKSNGKKRAGRGSATDPQSLYARKRRERINERLRILQNLVPNGTKVDLSTMLEEAVQYVKFLQLQIKLLSSDELWMYAPIAYNGMNLGFDIKASK
ncbi:hypothetical protein Cni_G10378 [Canna indica]|uniref:BHLH domain-containing protein n=1 Tax=Canna indica TaxID=4628 RepID=A0AAQ3K9T0_9LILI|nr:hypothetical protein Cni_G10378 [Canna indica]